MFAVNARYSDHIRGLYELVRHQQPNKFHRPKMCEINRFYKTELEEKFLHATFKRIEQVDGAYVTSAKNLDTSNDIRIFKETQVKRLLRSASSPFVSQHVKSKLAYFSQAEDKDEYNLYQLDEVKELQSNEEYAIQNIGHATQLIQIPHFNILTDPVFNSLSTLFYPEKTISHPKIENLPKIDVILISHNHRDHVDRHSLQQIRKYHETKNWPQPKVFVPMGDKMFFDQFKFDGVTEVEWFTKLTITKEVAGSGKKMVHFVSIPADHRSGRYGMDHHKSLVTGWIINPMQVNVILKYSGDSRSLTDSNQQATDAVLWNEIQNKHRDESNTQIPDIICFEPSGPNYTRKDMDITHQSTSYSALLKFAQAVNLARLSGKSVHEVLNKIQTVMMHHNKFELGPDRFNEGLFILKKLWLYLGLNEDELNLELAKQQAKLNHRLDNQKLKGRTPFTSRPAIATLPGRTSLLVHAKDFIIQDIKQIVNKLEGSNLCRADIKNYVISNTVFAKIGARMNNEQITNSKFDITRVKKYKSLSSRQCKI